MPKITNDNWWFLNTVKVGTEKLNKFPQKEWLQETQPSYNNCKSDTDSKFIKKALAIAKNICGLELTFLLVTKLQTFETKPGFLVLFNSSSHALATLALVSSQVILPKMSGKSVNWTSSVA